MSTYWGIDLGGTKIEIACFSIEGDKPKVHLRKRTDTKASLGYQHVLTEILEMVSSSEKEVGIDISKLGLGHPGVHCPKTGLIKNSNSQIFKVKI
jgi:fructokinase